VALCDGLDEAALAAIHHIGHRRRLRAGRLSAGSAIPHAIARISSPAC
jgi:hypothetical protein